VGGGADWVDWYRTRLDGRSFQFHVWLVKCLQRFAAIHSEFTASFGNGTLASEYMARAEVLLVTLRAQWAGDHWVTNPDYADEGEWYDDTVWSIYHGLASEQQTATLWAGIDRNTSFNEGRQCHGTRSFWSPHILPRPRHDTMQRNMSRHFPLPRASA